MLELKRMTAADPAAGYGEVFAFVIDLYESKGSLDKFDPVTREEIEETFNLLLKLQQKRLGVRRYPPHAGDPPLPVRRRIAKA